MIIVLLNKFTSLLRGGQIYGLREKSSMKTMIAFMSMIQKQDTRAYIESLIYCFAAPTIRGLKPGNLINLRRSGDKNIAAIWDAEKEGLLRRFRLSSFTLSARTTADESSVLILVYRKELLVRALFAEESRALLDSLGYGDVSNVESCLERLGERFQCDFPHEIGLFLGYPPKDVEGFIRNRGEDPLLVGCWKVYGNVRKARRTFRRYKQVETSAARALIRRARHTWPHLGERACI
ncbi:MAG: DUF3793 family protein [Synergistaceae bacterium]|jgi:hypothetical protein|nr:DUF3793 family protein [Synergistaceae bacterium]